MSKDCAAPIVILPEVTDDVRADEMPVVWELGCGNVLQPLPFRPLMPLAVPLFCNEPFDCPLSRGIVHVVVEPYGDVGEVRVS